MKDARPSQLRKGAARLGALATIGALAWSSATAASFSSACKQEPDPSAFDGGPLGYCSGYTAIPIAPAECTGCSGQAFALCNGDIFSECACELPGSYSLDAGTFEASVMEIEGGGLTALDEDASRQLPCCAGNTVFEIPADECPAHCSGTVAWAVCHENVYSECACSIPTGFTLSDIVCDGG